MLRKLSEMVFGSDQNKQKLVAFNENTKPLPLISSASKVFGFPDKISTNIAYDKYQGLLAFGTSRRIIKIFSLKGYEYEIYDAHKSSLRQLLFVPNQGILLSVDDHNEIRKWSLKEIETPPQICQITDQGPVVTSFYTPTYITSEPDNHNHVFIALNTGNIHIYDIAENKVTNIVIRYNLMFPERKQDIVTDMKLNPQKMHRLLIAFEETAVVMFSLNKNRDIQRIHFSEYDSDRGHALAVEFIMPECLQFVVGYSTGYLCLYKCENKSQKPSKIININAPSSYIMYITLVERKDLYSAIIVQYSMETPGQGGSGMETDIVMIYGKNFDQQVNLSHIVHNDQSDQFYMFCAGQFMLLAKNQALEKIQFKGIKTDEAEEKKEVTIDGEELIEILKEKHRSLNLYNSMTLFVLTNKQRFLYFNLDQLFSYQDVRKQAQVSQFDKIYGHSDKIVKSCLVSAANMKDQKNLKSIQLFRQHYLKRQLQKIFSKDKIVPAYFDEKLKKKTPKEINCDLEIECSLNYGQGLENFFFQPLGLLVTVDTKACLRMFAISSEQCELVSSLQIKLASPDDQVSSIHFSLKDKCILVTSEEGINLIINPETNSQVRILKEYEEAITYTLLYQFKHERFLVCGLESGLIAIKYNHQILTSDDYLVISPDIKNEDDRVRVTCIQAFQSNDFLIFGNAKLFITVFEQETKKQKTFKLISGTSHDYKVLQIEELIPEVEDAKNQIYYILTQQNLYCLAKKDHSVKAQYYKKMQNQMPKMVKFGFMLVKGQFSLTLMIQDGIFQMIDPFNLQPFSSFQIPNYSFDNYEFFNNILFGYGHNNFIIYELDQEIKKQKNESIFSQQSQGMGIFEEIRQTIAQPDIVFKKPTGMGKLFNKYITIKGSILKNDTESEVKNNSAKKRKSTYNEEEKSEDYEEMKQDQRDGNKRSKTPISSVSELNSQMGNNLNQLKQNTQKIEQIDNKAEKLMDASNQFKSMATAIKQQQMKKSKLNFT